MTQQFINHISSFDELPLTAYVRQRAVEQLGKTPSLYNRDGKVCGIAKWTSKHSTDKEVAAWRKEPDYGICIQTRYLRGIDIDIEDPVQVEHIINYIEDFLGFSPAIRSRSNSSKCLLAVFVKGEIPKEVLKFGEEGMVEFLGNGQQFIAAGTHPEGERYVWDHLDIQEISQKEYEALIFMMETDFEITRSKRKAGLRKRSSEYNAAMVALDSTLKFLEENNHVKSYNANGAANITCPYAHEHTMGDNGTSTTYFPAGTGGYDRGNFVCLHAHCTGRSQTDFLDAFEIRKADFDIVAISPEEAEKDLPPWNRNKKGEPLATRSNIMKALERPDICGFQIFYDAFRDEMLFRKPDDITERENDERITEIMIHLEEKYMFKSFSKDTFRDVIRALAKRNTIDAAIEWIENLKWDGVERIEHFLPNYFGTQDNEYTRAVSLYIWTAAAGRVVVPGLKADMIPIMKGPQGYMKSTAIAAMAPSMDEFCEVDFDENDADLARKMRGVLICEIPELRGLRTRAIEAIKAFVARTHEKWIPKYKEFSTTFPRRCIFIATTNDDEFLADTTGNRRWLPFDVHRYTDVKAIIRDREHLWAEARERFKKDGLLFDEAEKLAVEQHEKYMMHDSWHDIITDWLYTAHDISGAVPADEEYLLIAQIAERALNIQKGKDTRADKLRIADSLKRLGYVNQSKRIEIGGRKTSTKVWIAPDTDLA